MSLNVLDRGSGDAILALHGFTGTARTWSAQLDGWSADHRVIAPDLLGHGGSAAPADPASYALERQADALADLLRLLETGPAAVVGYSMGARLALLLVLRHPGLVDRMVLESPSPGIADARARAERRRTDDDLAARLEREGTEAFVAGWEAQPLFASHGRLPETVRGAQRAERLRHDPRALAASLRGAGQGAMAPLHERLGEIGVPTLVISGALDDAGRERAATVAAGIAASRHEVVEGAGHTPHLEQPQRFDRVTTPFLSTSHAKHTR